MTGNDVDGGVNFLCERVVNKIREYYNEFVGILDSTKDGADIKFVLGGNETQVLSYQEFMDLPVKAIFGRDCGDTAVLEIEIVLVGTD